MIGSSFLLLLASAIWGFTFVAQRVGMDHIGPFYFNAIRFTIGTLVLLPLIIWKGKKIETRAGGEFHVAGIVTGFILFMGISLQQVGLVYTPVGKAGFLTGFYMIIVPVLGIFLRQKVRIYVWAGAILALDGLYYLSIKDTFSLQFGDSLILLSALFWAFHILVLGRFSPKMHAFRLAIYQYAVCAVLSYCLAFYKESISLDMLKGAIIPILYAGIFSTAIAFTLQIIAQKKLPPANAAIIFSMESVFALLGGWMLLGEVMTKVGLIGCGLILAGMLISQSEEIFGRMKSKPIDPKA